MYSTIVPVLYYCLSILTRHRLVEMLVPAPAPAPAQYPTIWPENLVENFPLNAYSRGQNYRAGRVKKMFDKNHHNFFPSKHFAKF